MKNIIKSVLFIFVVILCFFSCSGPIDYTYKWKLAVVYTNGEKDTMNCQYDSFNGNNCYLNLKVSEVGLIETNAIDPCITMGCGVYEEAVTCGVRKYKILSLEKVLLNK